MKIVKVNPEFGIEIALAVPYAYWLHENNQLKTVITSKGMKPFYYFCDDVREEFKFRTIDNADAGLNDLPNNWIHHNAEAVTGKGYGELTKEEQENVNGVLDYSQWSSPPYKEYYENDEIKFDKPIIFITNKFNLEHGEEPFGYFSIKCLYDMFSYLTESGYTVVYKRVSNRESHFTIDQNEMNSILQGYHDISANVEGIGVITDRELTGYFEDVYLLDELIEKYNHYSYNEVQLKIMANSKGFITVGGGNTILSACFRSDVISYIHKGKDLRPNYYGKNSYFTKMSGANVMPVYDVIGKINDVETMKKYGHTINETGTNDYTGLIEKMKDIF